MRMGTTPTPSSIALGARDWLVGVAVDGDRPQKRQVGGGSDDRSSPRAKPNKESPASGCPIPSRPVLSTFSPFPLSPISPSGHSFPSSRRFFIPSPVEFIAVHRSPARQLIGVTFNNPRRLLVAHIHLVRCGRREGGSPTVTLHETETQHTTTPSRRSNPSASHIVPLAIRLGRRASYFSRHSDLLVTTLGCCTRSLCFPRSLSFNWPTFSDFVKKVPTISLRQSARLDC